jgi:GNAT superfamily N-acetyltransferase
MDELGVRDSGSRHPDEVAALLSEELLRDAGIVHAPAEEDRHVLEIDLERPTDLPIHGMAVVGRLHVGGLSPGVTDVDVDEIQGVGLGDMADHLPQLEQVVAPFAILLAVDPDAHGHGIADALLHADQRLAQELRPGPRVATPFVFALVHGRREEGLGKRLVGAVDLDAVDPRLHELLGGIGVGSDDLRDFVRVERVGDPVVGLDDGHRRRRHREVQLRELADHHGARLMDRFAELREALDEARHLEEGDPNRAGAGEELLGRLARQGRVQ